MRPSEVTDDLDAGGVAIIICGLLLFPKNNVLCVNKF